jgi:hypothetical protein
MAASEEHIKLYAKLMAGDIIAVECSLLHSLSDLKQRISQADSARDLNLQPAVCNHQTSVFSCLLTMMMATKAKN